MKHCRSVRPLILISAKDYGAAHIQGLKHLMQILIEMISQPSEHLSSFSVLFTKYTDEEEKSHIEEQIKALRSSIDNNGNLENTASFLLLISELQSKIVAENFKFVDLINGDRKEIMRDLEKINPIESPDEVFKFSISKSSKIALKEQLRKHHLAINSAIREKDYAFVDFKLKEIKYLNDLLKEENIKTIYEECLKVITKSIYLECEKVNILNLEIHLNQNDANEFKLMRHFDVKLQSFKNILDECFGNDEINLIEIMLSMIYSAKEELSYLEDYRIEIEYILNKIISKIMNFFNKSRDQIIDLFKNKNEDYLTKIEEKFKLLFKIFSIPKVSEFTFDIYFGTLEIICKHVDCIKKDICDLMLSLNSVEFNYDALYKLVNYFQDFQWIEQFKPGIYSNQMATIKRDMIEQVIMLKKSFFKFKLDIDNYQNIKKITGNLNMMNKIEAFTKYFPELTCTIQEVQKSFFNSTNESFAFIEETFSLKQPVTSFSLAFSHLKTAENALNYLIACQDIELTQIRAKNLLKELEIRLHYYSDTLKEELDLLMSSVTRSLSIEEKEKLMIDCNLLCKLIESLSVISKYSQLSSIIYNNENLFETVENKLQAYYLEVKEELEILTAMKQPGKLNAKLDMIKILRQIDEITEKIKFQSLYIEFSNSLKQLLQNIISEIETAIKSNDFPRLLEILTDLSNSKDPFLHYYFQKCKEILSTEINNWIDQTKVATKLIGSSLNEEDIAYNKLNEIIKTLYKFQKLETLHKFFAESDDMNKFHELLSKIVNNSFGDYLDEIKKSFENINFQTRGSSTINSDKIGLEILDPQYTDDLIKKFEYLETLINSKLEAYLKEDYEKKNIDSFQLKDIMEAISSIVKTKFRNEISRFRSSKSKQNKSVILKSLDSSLTILDDLHCILKKDIDNLKEEFKKESNTIEISIENYDFNTLENLMKTVEQMKNKIKEYFGKTVTEIKICLANNSISSALKYYKALKECQNFSSKNLNLSFHTEDFILKTELSIELAKLIEKATKFFQLKEYRYENKEELLNIQLCIRLLGEVVHSYQDKELKAIIDDILSTFYEDCLNLKNTIIQSFLRTQVDFREALKNMDVRMIYLSLENMKVLETYLNEINIFFRFIDENYVANLINNDLNYSQMVKLMENRLIEFKNEFKENFINEQTMKNEYERNKYYSNLNEKLKIAERISNLNQHNTCTEYFYSEIVNIIIAQRKVFLDQLDFFLHKTTILTTEDYKSINIYYLNLNSLENNIELNEFSDKTSRNHIKSKILRMADDIKNRIGKEETNEVAKLLMILKTMSHNIEALKKEIDEKIDEALQSFKFGKGKNGPFEISKLGAILNNYPIGKLVISEHKIFKGYSLSLFNKKTHLYGIEYVLENLEGDSINTVKLKKRYDEFEEKYNLLIKENLKPDFRLKKFASSIKNLHKSHFVAKWDSSFIDEIPILVAHIFALWTLFHCETYLENDGAEFQEFYQMKPHPAQVISIFRLLGIGDDNEDLINNLCEIGTGEGKSISLAVTACVFAIFGFDVNCVCYSEYLSTRDYQSFLPIFMLLGLVDSIQYCTFGTICGKIINEECNLNLVSKLINNDYEYNQSNILTEKPESREKILLIDEVDVFLSEFYGKSYRPTAKFNQEVKPLTDLIWEKRKKHDLNISYLKETEEYQSYCKNYQEWIPIIDNALNNMIKSVNNFDSPEYVVKNDYIGYVYLDGISFHTSYGYKTLFAYYHEHEAKRISDKSLNQNTYISVCVGEFSYAQIPFKFKHVFGVTGTLKTLSKIELDLLENIYELKKKTFVPSLFGKKNLIFDPQVNITIENEENYFDRIYREIDTRLKGKSPEAKRAVLVFFTTKKRLMKFYNSEAFSPLKKFAKTLTEEDNLTPDEKDIFIKDSTRSGMVNLITKAFGRGTDFVCRDETVQDNGGIHVIQTFLSEHLSEEHQIKGRTARQGDKGKYICVYCINFSYLKR